MIGPWERVEGSPHDDELDAGVEARVADPLWMLTRQWQVGELRGDDAANPIAARLVWHGTPLTSYRPGADGPQVPMPTASPLERVVEAAPPPRDGAAGLRWSTRLAAQVSRRLAREGLADAIEALAAEFALSDDDAVALPGAGTEAIGMLRRRGFDGADLLAAPSPRIDGALAHLDSGLRESATTVIEGWRDVVRARFATPPVDTWDDTRLEHRFDVEAATPDGEMTLTAREYLGGHLDWYSFDLEHDEASVKTPPTSPSESKAPVTSEVTAIPTPVRYSGMPAARWWAFEEGDVHFGDLGAAPGDLGRLLVADYATVYGNDWYSIPLRIPAGTLAQIRRLRMHDTMGGHLDIPPAATLDRRVIGRRSFRLYELTGDRSVAEGKAPFLLVPPSLSGSAVGPALERVELVRDEAANLAWGIERFVEGPTGVTVDRLQHWRTITGQPGSSPVDARSFALDDSTTSDPCGVEPASRLGEIEGPGGVDLPNLPDRPGGGGAAPGGPGRDQKSSGMWQYRLESTAPPFWIPFVPVRIGDRGQMRLRRAQMQEWQLLDPRLIGAKGELLQRHQPMVVEEEEVPSGGATLERHWQVARWIDGSVHVWLQRTKRAGYGERSSGLRWDTLHEIDGAAPGGQPEK